MRTLLIAASLVAAFGQTLGGVAKIRSLLTVLSFPARVEGSHQPFANAVIATVVENFDRIPPDEQSLLVGDLWSSVRSPLMLPVVQRFAESGNGPALLRWLELDEAGARSFMRQEALRPEPRFSSFYIRLPEAWLAPDEHVIEDNFVKLTSDNELAKSASLLHRYAGKAVLEDVLPFIEARFGSWSCAVKVPVLAYLLKVSAAVAVPRIQQTMAEARPGPCRTTTLLSDLGALQPDPALERIALAEIDRASGPFVADAIEYLRTYGSSEMKPLMMERLKKRSRELIQAFVGASGWILSRRDVESLKTLFGPEIIDAQSCAFWCGASLSADGPGEYSIYSHATTRDWSRGQSMDYLTSRERLHYSINQYRCRDMASFKRKILQFPAGSRFSFAYDFTPADRDEILEIAAYLRLNGYRVGYANDWKFVTPDPPIQEMK